MSQCRNNAKSWKPVVMEGQQNTHLFDTIFIDKLIYPPQVVSSHNLLRPKPMGTQGGHRKDTGP